MTNELNQIIEAVKLAKGTNRLHELASVYGTMDNALNALDCRAGTIGDRMAEAIKTVLAPAAKFSISKRDGKVVVS